MDLENVDILVQDKISINRRGKETGTLLLKGGNKLKNISSIKVEEPKYLRIKIKDLNRINS